MPFGSTPGVSIKDDGTPVLSPAATINCGSGLSATNDGGGQVTLAASGGTAEPGGTNGQIQYNNAGALGGLDSTGTGKVAREDSPTLIGTPAAPTAAPGTDTTQIATTAFVRAAVVASSYIDGEVEFHADLPVTLGTPAIDSAYLVRESSGIWLINRKPAGIWVRLANAGTLADWSYAGTFPDVFSDANFSIYDNLDTSKEIGFQLSGLTASNKRILTPLDKNYTLEETAHKAKHQHGGADEVATATAAANAIPKADASGKLDTWITDATTTAKGKVELATDGETAASVAVQGSDSRLLLASDIKRQGFLNLTETTIAFDGTNFTLGCVGSTWTYWRNGIRHTITGAPAAIPLSAATAGIYFIYIDGTAGALTCSAVNTPWTLEDTKVPIATIAFDSTLTPTYWISDERHTCQIDLRAAWMDHLKGAELISAPTLTGYTIDTDTNVAKTFAISACTLRDQDIKHSLAGLTDPNGTATDYVVWYRTGASTWKWKASNMPFVYNVGNTNNFIQYDNAGTMTDLTGGAGGLTRWTNSYLLITNKTGAAWFIIVPGRAVFTSLASAQAESIADFTWIGFEIDEAVIAYQLTWKTNGATSQGKCELDVAPRVINLSTVTNVSSGAGTDHATLANLNSADFSHITAAQVGPATVVQAQGTASIRAIGTTAPEAIGTAAAGSSTEAAAKDHVHALPDAAVTLAKMANLAASTFIGRKTQSTGVPEALSVLEMQQLLGVLTSRELTDSGDLAAADVGKVLLLNKGTAATLTIRKNAVTAYPVLIPILWIQTGAGQWTFTASAGDGTVTLNPRGAATKAAGQWAWGTLLQTSTDVWTNSGDLST